MQRNGRIFAPDEPLLHWLLYNNLIQLLTKRKKAKNTMLFKNYQVPNRHLLPMLFVSLFCIFHAIRCLCIFIATAMSSENQMGSERVTLHVEDNQVCY